jgi:dGTPase
MNFREKQEQNELDTLSVYAAKAMHSKGRTFDEPKCSIRTDYQRDRDRIIYSKAFRRLKHKTQVFISPEGDHYRTRLTHTLEVSQISRTIARSLNLNEDLAEAIALGHDLGHTPFGHSGENVLNRITPNGFRHTKQSIRVIDVLEKEGGLNLTWEVRNGILNHAGSDKADTLEGQIIKFADRIAYINHDIEDAIRAGILCENDLPKKDTDILGRDSRTRINNMIINIIESSYNKNEIRMDEKFYNSMMDIRKFMFENVYISSKAKEDEEKAMNLVESLYRYFLDNKNKLPKEYSYLLDNYDLETVVADYIAGMTDRYAIRKFKEFFIPMEWNK